jgi:hypothetical protein
MYSSTYSINNVADNKKYNIYIIDFDTEGMEQSPIRTVTVGDRTPPSINVVTVGGLAPDTGITNINPDAPIRIQWYDRDITGQGVDWSVSTVNIGGAIYTPSQISSNPPTVDANDGKAGITGWAEFQPQGQDYATTYNVWIQLRDYSGNHTD